jgi:hypothetical protein
MFAPLVARSQPKAATGATNSLARQHPLLVPHRRSHDLVSQTLVRYRPMEDQATQPCPPLAVPSRAGALQPKLAIGPVDDPLEQEADRVADQLLQPKPAGTLEAAGEAPDVVQEVLRSPGRPLDAATRAFFEPRFGHDFGRVRVHTDSRAAAAAGAIDALAYTVGQDVVFGSGMYAPGTSAGQRLLAHELTHVVQQGQQPDGRPTGVHLGRNDDSGRQADATAAGAHASIDRVQSVGGLGNPVVQRDLARPPRGAPAQLRQLTPEEIQAAITFNQNRFSDPYSIRVIRDVLGLEPVPAVVDEELILAVVEWQSERHLTQDGQIGHTTTRSIYLELVAEGEFRDAILLVMDSYRLPEDLRLNDVRVGTGATCCGAGGGADAVTFGGPHCPPVGGPVTICFCRPRIPQTVADYDHFVRITGHELIHVPQCAAGTGDVHVDEFEAFFFEACNQGRAPQLAAADRVNHANIALAHFAAIPAALQTPARIAMRNQLNALVAAGGVGPC